MCASINFDNQLWWLQYQIVRNSLQTNYIVSHFKPNVSPTCTYCRNLDNLDWNPNNLEKISHLFWTCVNVCKFLGLVFRFICSTGLVFETTKSQFLFGFPDEGFSNPRNYIRLIIKKYIWQTKFKTTNLSLVGLKAIIKSYLIDLKYIFQLKDKPDQFNEWNIVFNSL